MSKREIARPYFVDGSTGGSETRTNIEWSRGFGILVAASTLPVTALAQEGLPPEEAYESSGTRREYGGRDPQTGEAKWSTDVRGVLKWKVAF